MKQFLTPILLVLCLTASGQDPCNKCDIEKIRAVNENLTALTSEIISNFLCTLDNSCKTSAEFSEWSNETIFKVLDNAPKVFLQVAAKNGNNISILLTEIQNPIHDTIDFQSIYSKLKQVQGRENLKRKFLDALIIAADKSGQKIIR